MQESTLTKMIIGNLDTELLIASGNELPSNSSIANNKTIKIYC